MTAITILYTAIVVTFSFGIGYEIGVYTAQNRKK